MHRLGGLVGLVALVLGVLVAPAARATASDEVSPEEDNPPGCTTATSETTPQCGAQGRDHFASSLHRPPVEACDVTRPDGSTAVTRVLPDGPRNADGSLAFISGVCVYLPPGYGTSGLRYPVVYLLHGGGGDQSDWVSQGNVQQLLDDAYAADPAHAAIAVMPDGRSGFWFDSYDGTMRIETYVLDHVVLYIDRHFDTIADRSGRAISGLSNGGYGAMHLAAKRPDLFVAAGAMSANIGGRGFGNLGTPVPGTGQSFQEAGATYYGSAPIELASNLDPVDLTMDAGEYCVSDPATCALVAVDVAFGPDNQAFRKRLADERYSGTLEYREPEEGAHAWLWWTTWLRTYHLPFFWARLQHPTADPVSPSRIPQTFRYRTIKDAFTIFGYDVRVDRPVREFLDLTDVTAGGFTARGSGVVTVVTAPRYKPNAKYLVDGALVRADRAGRLRVVVDLGPAHANEQYTPAGRIDEATAGDAYWTTRTVTIER